MSRQIINGEYRFNWLPTQKAAARAVCSMEYDNTLYSGGFGSGKSILLGEIAFKLSKDYNGSEFLFWRKTRASIKATTYRLFLEKVIPPEYIHEHNKSELWIIDKFGSRYDFLGLDKITRKGSYWGDVALVDEAIELNEAEFRMIEGRLRAKHLPRPQTINTTNPGAPGCFWHEEFVIPEKRKNTNAFFTASSFENIYNPPYYFQRLEKWKGTQYYDRYALGKWAAFRGNIYENFDPAVHCIHPFRIPENWRHIMGIDFGFDHPLVLLWGAVDPLGNYYVYRQYYMTHVLVRKAAKIGKGITAKAKETLETLWADHDAENRAQLEEDWDWETTPAHKEVLSGIQEVQGLMLPCETGKPKLFIFTNEWVDAEGLWYGNLETDLILKEEGRPTCLQEEIPGYKWGKNDQPVKINDDGCDALRYMVYSDMVAHGKTQGIGAYTADSYSRT